MDCIVHEVAKSRTRLGDFHLEFRSEPLFLLIEFHPLRMLILSLDLSVST